MAQQMTPQTRIQLQRISDACRALAGVTGLPPAATGYLWKMTEGGPAWLHAVADLIGHSRETTARRLADVFASFYLAGYITRDQFQRAPSELVGPWAELGNVEMPADERTTYLELLDEQEWTDTARHDTLSSLR